MQEVLDAGPDRPRRSPPRRVVVGALLVGLVVAGIITTSLLRGRTPAPRPATAAATSAASVPSGATTPTEPATCTPLPIGETLAEHHAGSVSAVVFGRPAGATALTRLDTTAERGPWTVVVRRDDGSLGRHGAVVTFPVRAADTARDEEIVWTVAGAHARVRGDLGRAALLDLARRTRVVQGRPVVRPPRGIRVIAAQPYRPREVHELRYRERGDLGDVGAALGFVYTGVLRGGGFEDALYAGSPSYAGTVQGHEAVVSPVMGGNATLAWAPAPGVVAYVGYSGSELNQKTVSALRCLARRTRPLTEAEWRAASPFVVAQTNDFG